MAFGKKNFKIPHAKDYRSGLEESVQEDLRLASIDAEYETIKIEWEDLCYRKYTPDFLLPNGIIIETKGQFQLKIGVSMS